MGGPAGGGDDRDTAISGPAVVRAALRPWGAAHLRDFPWRRTTDPFLILLAELMLRRTRAAQVAPVYAAFTTRYPDARSLAAADAGDVAGALRPLGLTWRVPAFTAVARALVADHGGAVPASYAALAALPGVGDYVASAVCCFAYGQALPLVDTNTVRVAGRLVGRATHAGSRRHRWLRELLAELVDPEEPRAYHYALLDLAATICTPARPACPRCPLRGSCAIGRNSVAAPPS